MAFKNTMMDDKQIEIGDKLLKLFIDNEGQLQESKYHELLKKELVDYNSNLIFTTVIIMIEDYCLIRRNINNTGLKIITAEGLRAAKIGLKQYIQDYEEQKELEKENLKANIKTAKLAQKNAKYSLTISIIALILSAIVPVLVSYSENNNDNSSECCKQKVTDSDTAYNKPNISDSLNTFK